MSRFPFVVVILAASALSLRSAAQFKLGGGPPPDMPAPGEQIDATTPSQPTDEPDFTLPEFPPGLFTDGQNYRLNDLRGKTIVLFFFDPSDDRARATIAQRNALARRFGDKPVAFFAVVRDSIDNARLASDATGIRMPIFADTLGVLAARYHVILSARQTWQGVVIDGQGRVVRDELTELALLAALPTARWTYRDRPHDPRLRPVVDALESGDFHTAARLLTAAIAGVDRRLADAARNFRHDLRADAERWLARARHCEATTPATAHDLYARVHLFFGNTEYFRSVADALKRLESTREVKDERAARAMYTILSAAVSRDGRVRAADAAAYCDEIIRSHPGTPTAERLIRYLDDLGKSRAPTRSIGRRPAISVAD